MKALSIKNIIIENLVVFSAIGCTTSTPDCKYLNDPDQILNLNQTEIQNICQAIDSVTNDSIFLFFYFSDTLPTITETTHITNQILSANQTFNLNWIILFIANYHKEFYVHFCPLFKSDVYMQQRSDVKHYVYQHIDMSQVDLIRGYVTIVGQNFAKKEP